MRGSCQEDACGLLTDEVCNSRLHRENTPVDAGIKTPHPSPFGDTFPSRGRLIKEKADMRPPWYAMRKRLLGKAGFDQFYQTLDRVDLIGTVGKDLDGGAADDTQRKHAEE